MEASVGVTKRIVTTARIFAAVWLASEILGLKGSCLYDDHIYVCMQHDIYGYRPTKTKAKHNIPLPTSLIDDLKLLKEKNGDGYLFSTDGGGRPVCRKTVLMYLRKALINIGITAVEIIAYSRLEAFLQHRDVKGRHDYGTGAGDNNA